MSLNRVLIGAALLGLWTGACRGPARAPHQPITGVDLPREERGEVPVHDGRGDRAQPADPSPADRPPEDLDGFVTDLGSAHARSPGLVVVFPALSPADGGGRHVNGLGEDLMRRTAAGLRDRGVAPVWDGARLISALRAVNRGPRQLQNPNDALRLAERLGARYVVFGEAALGFDGRRLDRRDYVSVDWEARDLAPDGPTVARYSAEEGRTRTFALWHELYQREARWPGGAPQPPDLWAEFKFLSGRLAAELVGARPDLLAGDDDGPVRVAALPTQLPIGSTAQRRLLEFADAFERAWNDAAARHGAEAAMDAPVTVGSAQYPQLREALDDYRLLRREYEETRGGTLGRRLSQQVVEDLSGQPGTRLMRSLDHEDLSAILWTIRVEARRARDEGTVDADTLAELRGAGSQLLLRTAIEQVFEGRYQLRLTLTELDSGESVSGTAVFERVFSAQLAEEVGS